MAKLITGIRNPSTPARKLQLRVKKDGIEVVDKETGQPIEGVNKWEVNHSLDFLSGRVTKSAKIEIIISDPADIWISDEVEGTIVDASLPAPVLMINEKAHPWKEVTTNEE